MFGKCLTRVSDQHDHFKIFEKNVQKAVSFKSVKKSDKQECHTRVFKNVDTMESCILIFLKEI